MFLVHSWFPNQTRNTPTPCKSYTVSANFQILHITADICIEYWGMLGKLKVQNIALRCFYCMLNIDCEFKQVTAWFRKNEFLAKNI